VEQGKRMRMRMIELMMDAIDGKDWQCLDTRDCWVGKTVHTVAKSTTPTNTHMNTGWIGVISRSDTWIWVYQELFRYQTHEYGLIKSYFEIRQCGYSYILGSKDQTEPLSQSYVVEKGYKNFGNLPIHGLRRPFQPRHQTPLKDRQTAQKQESWTLDPG
jgi:hypothetical protein